MDTQQGGRFSSSVFSGYCGLYPSETRMYPVFQELIAFFEQPLSNRRCRLKYIRDSLVLWRNFNVSFQDAGGLVKRFLLDFNGYLQLADKYFTDDQNVRNAFLKVMTREHPWYTIINVTSFIDNTESWRQFKSKMLAFGYNPRMVGFCYALGRHKNLVSLAVKMKRRIVRSVFHRWIQGITELLLYRRHTSPKKGQGAPL